MKETIFLLKVTHKKPMPKQATDIVAQRFYSWLYSQGVEAGVTATLVGVPHEFLRASEASCGADEGERG